MSDRLDRVCHTMAGHVAHDPMDADVTTALELLTLGERLTPIASISDECNREQHGRCTSSLCPCWCHMSGPDNSLPRPRQGLLPPLHQHREGEDLHCCNEQQRNCCV